ncbi:MAG: hypothetical protein ACR2P5_00525, partial [Gammaproteobacteria bacterium]
MNEPALLAEAYKRDLLPTGRKTAYEEAVRRGLVEDPHANLVIQQREYEADRPPRADQFFAGIDALRAAQRFRAADRAFTQSGMREAQEAGVPRPAPTNEAEAISQRLRDRLTGGNVRTMGGSPTEAEVIASFPTRAEALPEIEADLQRSSELDALASSVSQSPVAQATANAPTFGQSLDAFKVDPTAAMRDIFLRSGGASLYSLGHGVAGGLLTGNLAGFVAGVGTGSFSADYVMELHGALKAAGVDTSDPQALMRAIEDTGFTGEARNQAALHAAFVGTFDALTAGVAGTVLAPPIKSQLARQAINAVLQTGAQGIGGALGELTGQLAQHGEVRNPGAAVAEFVGELPTAVVDVPLAQAAARRDRRDPVQEQIEAEIAA